MITVVSWNIAKRQAPWRQLLDMDADIALLQEAVPPDDAAELPLDVGPQESWDSHSWNRHRRPSALYDRWPMVVRLSDRVDVEWFTQVGPIGWPQTGRDRRQRHRHDYSGSGHAARRVDSAFHRRLHVRQMGRSTSERQHFSERVRRRFGAPHHI